jgi:hypothetical protein
LKARGEGGGPPRPPMENQIVEPISRCFLYQANLMCIESQQLQGQVTNFKDLDEGAPKKSDLSQQKHECPKIMKRNMGPSKF